MVVQGLVISRRDSVNIIADILRLEKVPKTKYRTTMNNSRLQKYLDFMTEQGLLEKTSQGNSTIYKRTEKGGQLLEQIDSLLDMLIAPTIEGLLEVVSY